MQTLALKVGLQSFDATPVLRWCLSFAGLSPSMLSPSLRQTLPVSAASITALQGAVRLDPAAGMSATYAGILYKRPTSQSKHRTNLTGTRVPIRL